MLKPGWIIVLVCIGLSAKSQIDIKNALPDLLREYSKSGKDVSTVRTALAISNFYLYNKSHNLYIDSSFFYVSAAENLSRALGYKKGIEDAQVVKASALLIQDKIKEVEQMGTRSSGSLHARLYLQLGKYYLEKVGEEKSDLDRADSYFIAVQVYALKYHMPTILLTSQIYRYKVLKEKGIEDRICEKEFLKIINLCKVYHNKAMEARAWVAKGSYSGSNQLASESFLHVVELATAAKDTGLAIWARKEIADNNLKEGQLDEAEKQLLQVVKQYAAAGYRNLQFTYHLLAAVSRNKAKFETAMQYGLTGVSYADSTGTDISLDFMQYGLAQLCETLGQHQESLEWYRKCLEISSHQEHYFYGVYRTLALEEIASGQAKIVLKKLDATLKIHPPDATNAYYIPLLKGDCYAALRQPVIAERYYLEGIKMIANWQKKNFVYYWSFRTIATFYIQEKAYKKADYYLSEILKAPDGIVPITDLASVHQLKFKADSAMGNYVNAIKHFEISKAITDSIFTRVRLKQTEELQFHFKTSQKERENLVLRNRNSLQQSELGKEELNRKLITTGLLAAILIIGILFYYYLVKQRVNKHLKTQQDEINQQNAQLSQLLDEKEWLNKEIHHRVKNNLQIISSLLNTQSAYLQHEEARTAIRDSQNRMQAISIVHQKLYQSDDLVTINFKSYIEELVRSICNSFHSNPHIQFEFNIVEAYLSTADNVSIGLMLNEAITNSIKYAFTATPHPRMTIAMVETDDLQFKLTIRDNGKGLPDNFDINGCTSLGINLMVGLTQQISGKFDIYSDHGTVVTIMFPQKPTDYQES